MWILAFEFSSDRRSVAVARIAGGVAEVMGHAFVEGVRRTPALEMAESALRGAGIVPAQVSTLAIGLGPGSYTGIRIALALAQGWELGHAVRCVGLRANDLMAEQAWRAGRRGPLNVAIDAQRGDFYHARYVLDDVGWRETTALAIKPAAELRSAEDGAWLTPEAVPKLPDAETLFPDAAALATMAASRTDTTPAALLEPVYLRATSFVKAPPGRIVPGLTDTVG